MAIGFLCSTTVLAQNSGMMPITGLRYYKDGIWAKAINAKMNGLQLMGNRIPLGAEIVINLQQPTGFTADKKKTIFPAARYALISAKGDTLQKMDNLLLLNKDKGFTPKDLAKGLEMKFGIAEKMVQPNSKCMVSIVLYDTKGKNQLRLEYPVTISYPKERIPQVPTMPQVLKSPAGSSVMAFGLTSKDIKISVDTAFSSNPKWAFLLLEVNKLAGIDIINLLQGKETFWVYDGTYEEIKIKEKLMKDVGGAFGTGSVNCSIRVPFRLKNDSSSGYVVRYRWDGPDKTQALDIVAVVK